MDEDLVVKGLVIPGSELEETFHTSGGPGGQHANRSETAVRLRFDVIGSSLPTDAKDRLIAKLGEVVEVTASDERSQLRNRMLARERMVSRLETALRQTRPRRKTARTRASNERRLSRKRARSEKKRLRRRPDGEM